MVFVCINNSCAMLGKKAIGSTYTVEPFDLGTFSVFHKGKGWSYIVDVLEGTCSCEAGMEWDMKKCRHRRMVSDWLEELNKSKEKK